MGHLASILVQAVRDEQATAADGLQAPPYARVEGRDVADLRST